MIPEPYNSWPVTMSVTKAAKLLGKDKKTLLKSTQLLEKCITRELGNRPQIIRDRLLRELKII